jgi:hypothetical protein
MSDVPTLLSMTAPEKPPKERKSQAKERHPLARFKYGEWWAPMCDPDTGKAICQQPDWMIERKCYLKGTPENHPADWLGKAEHFRRMITCIWASPVSKNPFQWNPNASRIVDAYFEHDYLAIAGHGSSSKSETIAITALAESVGDPVNTACLVTSTTIPEARGRIWGRIEYYYQDMCDYFEALGQHLGFKDKLEPPIELVSSSAIIRFRLDNRKETDRGIKLVPGKESEVREGVGRMKGFKARRMRFFADELSDLSHKLLEAAESNLFINPDFKMVGCFNPASHFDPGGVFAEPIGGWNSIDVAASDGWRTKRGFCIRFDAEQSPNVLAGREIWRGLITREKLDEARKNLGDNSPRFIEQYRGMWALTGAADCIYSEAEVIKYLGMHKVTVWEGPTTIVAGFDPSFTHGGDRAALVIGKVGKAACFDVFRPCVEVQEVLYLDENLDTTSDKKELIISRLKDACLKHGVSAKNLAMDATGGGDVLATLMRRDPFFGNDFMRVQFGGEASDMIFEGRKCRDKFVNMASELWYAGKPLLRMGQIKGLKPSIVREMTLRLYTEQSQGKKRIKIDLKEDMKKRTNGRSPDTSDAFFLMLHVCRSRHGLANTETVKRVAPKLESVVKDDPFGWGKPKKARINEPAYVPGGGGWGDEERGGLGNLFG